VIVDHVTYHVSEHFIHGPNVGKFFEALGMVETDPNIDPFEVGWDVRWFKYPGGEITVHLAAQPDHAPPLGMSHFCIRVPWDRYQELARSAWVERNSGSGRFWLAGPCGIRVEVRAEGGK